MTSALQRFNEVARAAGGRAGRKMAGYAANLLKVLAAATRYAAAGMGTGALALLLSRHLGLSPYLAFFGGFWLPHAPLYFYFSSSPVMAKQLRTFKEWKDQGLISDAQYENLRERMLGWYATRLYGEGGAKASGRTRRPQQPTGDAGPSGVAGTVPESQGP